MDFVEEAHKKYGQHERYVNAKTVAEYLERITTMTEEYHSQSPCGLEFALQIVAYGMD